MFEVFVVVAMLITPQGPKNIMSPMKPSFEACTQEIINLQKQISQAPSVRLADAKCVGLKVPSA